MSALVTKAQGTPEGEEPFMSVDGDDVEAGVSFHWDLVACDG